MRRVAAVVAWVLDHWKGPEVDKDAVIAAALVHDLGNIVKFDFDWPGQAQLVGEEWNRKEYWKAVQETVFARYGTKHDDATDAMLAELGADPSVGRIVHATGYQHLPRMAQHGSWEEKLLVYGDLRVAPHGIVSREERMREGRERYAQLHPRVRDSEGFVQEGHAPFTHAGADIENAIAAHTSAPLHLITDQSAAPYVESFS